MNSRLTCKGLKFGCNQDAFFAMKPVKANIISDPTVMMGKAVVAGTRITVELILEKLAAGETPDQIIQSHPRLNRDAINAALGFAARALKADVVYPIDRDVA